MLAAYIAQVGRHSAQPRGHLGTIVRLQLKQQYYETEKRWNNHKFKTRRETFLESICSEKIFEKEGG